MPQDAEPDVERVTALRLEAAFAQGFVIVRCFVLAQAVLNLLLTFEQYRAPAVAALVCLACVVETALVGRALTRSGRLTRPILLGDALFGLAGIAAMTTAQWGGLNWLIPSTNVTAPGGFNWMGPYTLATCGALGILAPGDLTNHFEPQYKAQEIVRRFRNWGYPRPHNEPNVRVMRGRWWAPSVALLLAMANVAASTRLGGVPANVDVIRGVGNYVLFFLIGAITATFFRRSIARLAARDQELEGIAVEVARTGQWRATVTDVFAPVIELLDEVLRLKGDCPDPVRSRADRLIEMIDALRPEDGGTRTGDEP
jgi:hypothetical protein